MPSQTPTAEELLLHAPFLRRMAIGLLGDEHRAADVVQEAYSRALTSPPRDRERLGAWLGQVVRNLSHKLTRGEARGRGREAEVARPELVPSAAAIAERESVRREVIEAVLALESPYRDVLLLRYYEDLPPREIARRLARPVETVRTQLKRGLQALEGRLDSTHGGDRRAWAVALAPFAARPGRAAAIASLPLGLKLATAGLVAAGLGYTGYRLGRADAPRDGIEAPGGLGFMTAGNLDGERESPTSGERAAATPPPTETKTSAGTSATSDQIEWMRGLTERLSEPRGFGMGGPRDGPGVFGRIVDRGGEPLLGAQVSLIHEGRDDLAPWRQTDTRGRFYFADVPDGSYTLRAFLVAQGTARLASIDHLEGEETDVGAITVHDPGEIRGNVRLPDGTPAAELWVAAAHVDDASFELKLPTQADRPMRWPLDRATRPGGRAYCWVQTDAAGDFRLTGLPPGPYALHLQPEVSWLSPPGIRCNLGDRVSATVEFHRVRVRLESESGKRLLGGLRYAVWHAPRASELADRFDEVPVPIDSLAPPPDARGYMSTWDALFVQSGDLVVLDAQMDGYHQRRTTLLIDEQEFDRRVELRMAAVASDEASEIVLEVATPGAEPDQTTMIRLTSATTDLAIDATDGKPITAASRARFRVPPGAYLYSVRTHASPGSEQLFLDSTGRIEVRAGQRVERQVTLDPAGKIGFELHFPDEWVGREDGRLVARFERLDVRAEAIDHTFGFARVPQRSEVDGPRLAPGSYAVSIAGEGLAEIGWTLPVRPHETTRRECRLELR